MTAWRPRELACDEIGSSGDPLKPLSISAYKRARQVLEEQRTSLRPWVILRG